MRTERHEPKMSFVASCRLHGTTLFFIERFSMTFDDSELVMDEGGRIPVFSSDAAARAAIARRFPLPRGATLTEQSSIEELAAAMEDDYGKKIKLAYDLDAARQWAQAPGPAGITPAQALEVWELCFQVGDAPLPQRIDPMYMVALHENIARDPQHRDAYEVALLGMKLSGIVHLSREQGRPLDWDAPFPAMDELWPPTDYPRLARILEEGVAGFAKRVRLMDAAPADAT